MDEVPCQLSPLGHSDATSSKVSCSRPGRSWVIGDDWSMVNGERFLVLLNMFYFLSCDRDDRMVILIPTVLGLKHVETTCQILVAIILSRLMLRKCAVNRVIEIPWMYLYIYIDMYMLIEVDLIATIIVKDVPAWYASKVGHAMRNE